MARRCLLFCGLALLLLAAPLAARADGDGDDEPADAAPELDDMSLEDQIAELQRRLTAKQMELDAERTQHKTVKKALHATRVDLEFLREEKEGASKHSESCKADLKAAKEAAAESQACVRKLHKATSELSSLAAAAEQASSCSRSLKKVESKLSEQASLIAQLKAVEDALLPVWLSRRLDQGAAWSKQQWAALRESDVAGKLQPHLDQLMHSTRPARDAAMIYVTRAKEAISALPVADTLASAGAAAKQQFASTEAELRSVLAGAVASQPALKALDDPVMLQLLTYGILASPLLLLGVVAAVLGGGASKPAARGGAAKKGKGSARADASTARVTRATAVKQGRDVVYVP